MTPKMPKRMIKILVIKTIKKVEIKMTIKKNTKGESKEGYNLNTDDNTNQENEDNKEEKK